MKEIVEERAARLGEYIVKENATVRATACKFGISKSTVHTEVTITNGLCGW
ncbi:MAG: sporulation transcriptional regulator SpoIIID [Clostridia bacterium]|nr:sporulation transcriptional regulator SpoIIID [Clostridia bacterium]